MSGIAKPMIHFSNSLTPSLMVPVEDIAHAEAIDFPALPNNPASTARYVILISLKPDNVTKFITVEFASSAARNTSVTNMKTAISTAVA